jgi:single-stranded-DNA-specific exonuclease
MRQFKLPVNDIDPAAEKELHAYDPLLRRLLYNRGITTRESAAQFLSPDWERDTHDPFLLLNMERAVVRIFQAIDAKESIVVYGDYDCDGIPGATLLNDFFQKIGYEKVRVYIPHRHDEGYGFGDAAVNDFIEEKIDLVITVDVGIADIETVRLASENGIDVIVTDHHLPIKDGDKEVLPPAFAIINPKQDACTYPDPMLCGAGVAFKLVQALITYGRRKGRFDDIPKGWEKWLLDMAGLSTIADMVPLQNENRTLAHFGLAVMRKSRRPGLVQLLENVGVKRSEITEDDVGFMIAPRINAASRLDHPQRAYELLSATTDEEAMVHAKHLEHINDQRKGYVAAAVKEARKRLNKRELTDVIVIGHPEWRPGVLGLIAGKIVEEYGRPAFVWGHDGHGEIKGSTRTDGSVSVVELMRAVPEDTFIQFGGHHASGGFTVTHENVHTLEEVLVRGLEKMEQQDAEAIEIDAELNLDDISWQFFDKVNALAPFGMGNSKPLFYFRSVTVERVREFGKAGTHLGLDLRSEKGNRVEAIGFFMDRKSFPEVSFEEGVVVDLVAHLERSTFKNYPQLRLRIVHIASSGTVGKEG